MSNGLGLPKPLAEMSDRELDEELQRRRRLRAASRRPEAPITDAERQMLARFERQTAREDGGGEGGASWVAAAAERVDLARHYAALELKPGATLAQVEAAYKALVAKYDPTKHAGDPERHRAATQLVQELGRSYAMLVERLRR
ncbi:DnaJ domain-containing protein [Sandaracinus amylolyticus]|uniref:DnaJ domain-containing protein n=1 Tax=Sandaracinus amylolyticus TaxID=927083 RepID=UPI001F3C5485|nr:DnaJ domain-containing protein [Sandaracinus amylolyticus]UJR81223.1 J domain-containing protein [Sandaracinus amylolyticus]